jgi:hypothetical protein
VPAKGEKCPGIDGIKEEHDMAESLGQTKGAEDATRAGAR